MSFVLDREGGAEVLKTISAQRISELASSVSAAAGSESSITTKVSKTRFVATVRVPAASQAKDGVLSRAAAQVGLVLNQYPKKDSTKTKETREKTGRKRGRPRKNPTT